MRQYFSPFDPPRGEEEEEESNTPLSFDSSQGTILPTVELSYNAETNRLEADGLEIPLHDLGPAQVVDNIERNPTPPPIRYERKHKEDSMNPELLEKATNTIEKEFKPNSERPQPFTRRTYGFEIEFFCRSWRSLEQGLERAGLNCMQAWYRNSHENTWFIHGDGSLHTSNYGFSDTELNTPPLRYTTGLDELAKACNVIEDQDWDLNPSCGLHLHIGASSITPAQYIRMIHYYQHYEAAIDKMMPPDRRGDHNSYCGSLQNHAFQQIVDNFIYPSPEYWDRDTLWGHMPRERYSKVGITSAYDNHNTIEFRHHEGTVGYEDMHFWMRFITAIIDKASSPYFTPRGDRDNLCHALQELNLQDYVNRYLLAKSYKYERDY